MIHVKQSNEMMQFELLMFQNIKRDIECSKQNVLSLITCVVKQKGKVTNITERKITMVVHYRNRTYTIDEILVHNNRVYIMGVEFPQEIVPIEHLSIDEILMIGGGLLGTEDNEGLFYKK